jgi:hypothetical protein
MTQEEPKEDVFYALRAQKRAEEFEKKAHENEGILPSARSNYAGWIAEGEVPLNVLAELGSIEDEGTFWAAVDWYFEEAGLHPVMESEDVAKAIRRIRLGEPPIP